MEVFDIRTERHAQVSSTGYCLKKHDGQKTAANVAFAIAWLDIKQYSRLAQDNAMVLDR